MTPHIDNFEASEPTRPADVKHGDMIAVTGSLAHKVEAIRPVGDGLHWTLTLRTNSGNAYEITRRSPLPVVKP